MRKCFVYFVISAVLLLPLFACAQAPGYMGKRNTIGYQVNLWLVHRDGVMARGYSHEPKAGFSLLNGHSLFLERTIKRKSSLRFETQYRRFGTGNITRLNREDLEFSRYYKMKSLSFRFRFKFFPLNYRGLLAPIGPYLELVLGASGASSVLITEHPDLSGQKASFRAIDSGFGFGHHWIVADRFMIDAGMQFIFPGSWRVKGYPTKRQDYNPFAAYLGVEALNFKVGFGYLLNPKK